MLPLDQPWSPLFEQATVEVIDVSGSLRDERTSLLRICWTSPARVTAPLALPPPWSGTVEIGVEPGCTAARLAEYRGHLDSLVLGEETFDGLGGLKHLLPDGGLPGLPPRPSAPTATFTTSAEAHVDGRALVREASTADLMVLSRGEVTLLPADQHNFRYFLGDALPWAVANPDTRLRWFLDGGPASDLSAFAEFVERMGVSLPELLERTGRGPYAGIGVNLVLEREDHSGTLRAAARPALASALRDHVASESLSAEQERWRQYWLDRYAGAAPLGPIAGTATLAVGPTIVDVTVSGRVVFQRDRDERIAALTENRTETVEVEVPVPADEGVLLRVSTVGYSAGAGQWMTDTVEAWSVLLPGRPYELRHTLRIGAPGPTCFRVEGAPDGSTAAWQGGRLVVKPEGRHFPVEVRPTEPGVYTVVLRAQGAERVRYVKEGCGA